MAAEHSTIRPVGDPGSKDTIEMIRSRLNDCISHHPECSQDLLGDCVPSETLLPSRVVEVGENAARLISSDRATGRYATLSHCWGGHTPIMTLKENLSNHLAKLPFSRLPKTFREAINLCFILGIPYLWIDSLCIVQDDGDDWLIEAQKMGQYYANAFFTIAANAAKNGDQGCFVAREEEIVARFPCNPADLSSGYMQIRPQTTWLYKELYSDLDDLHGHDMTRLNSRAWVLQESILSRRIIHCAKTQVYWECHHHIVAESDRSFTSRIDYENAIGGLSKRRLRDGIKGISRASRCAKNASGIETTRDIAMLRQDFYREWIHLLYQYTSCGLTKPRDRLPALLGIAERLGASIDLEYLHGHWNDNSIFFLCSLLWFSNPSIDSSVRPTRMLMRAPSWSWASVEGRVQFYQRQNEHRQNILDDENLLKVVDIAFVSPYCQPGHQALILMGSLHFAFVDTKQTTTRSYCRYNLWMEPLTELINDRTFDGIQEHFFQTEESLPRDVRDGLVCLGLAYLDCGDERAEKLWMVPVDVHRDQTPGRRSNAYYCLLLSLVGMDEETPVFRKVGYAETNRIPVHDGFFSKSQCCRFIII